MTTPEILSAFRQHLASLPPASDLVFVDVETTGLDPREDEIIEIALIRVDARTFEEKGRLAEKIRPRGPVPEEVARLNGYGAEKWSNAREANVFLAKDFRDEIRRLLNGARWAGSSPNFDREFLSWALGLDLRLLLATHRTIDVSGMVEPLVAAGLMERSGLDAIVEFFGIDASRRHTAEGDAEIALEAYKRILEFFAAPIVERVRADAKACPVLYG